MFETSASPDRPHPLEANYRGWSGRLGVWLLLGGLAAMFAVVSWLVFTTPLTRNELGLLGGLRLIADSQTTLFVGDRRVGTDLVDVSWNELLGAAGRPPLAISVDSPPTDEEIATALGEDDATILWQRSESTGTYRGVQDVNYGVREFVFQRNGGSLDHVLVLVAEVPTTEGQWRHFLLPIRARRLENRQAKVFLTVTNLSGGNVNRGMIPSRRDRATFQPKLTVEPRAVPDELADAWDATRLWSPTAD